MHSPRPRSALLGLPTFGLTSFGLATLVAVATCGSIAPLVAQREQAEAKVDRWVSVIDYGVPRFGKHTIDEVPVGGAWRLGQNLASTWTTDLPVIAGDALVAPGQYRVRLARYEHGFALEAEGAAAALGSAGTPPLMPGELQNAKHTDRLEIEWKTAKDAGQAGPALGAARPYEVQVRFGPHHLKVPLAIVGARAVGKVPGHELLVFGYAADVVEKRLAAGLPTVVASLRPKGKPKKDEPELWNLVLAKDDAQLLAGMKAPTASFGFGEVAPPAAEWGRDVDVQWANGSAPTAPAAAGAAGKDGGGAANGAAADAGGEGGVQAKDAAAPAAAAGAGAGKGEATFTVRDAKMSKGKVELQFAFGARAGTMSFELPTRPK